MASFAAMDTRVEVTRNHCRRAYPWPPRRYAAGGNSCGSGNWSPLARPVGDMVGGAESELAAYFKLAGLRLVEQI